MAMSETSAARAEKIPVGISSCLLGEEVRFDGGHKRDSYILGTLSDYFDFRPVCPEVAIGLPIPRPPIRLVQQGDGIHVVGVKDPTVDVTDKLHDYGKQMAGEMHEISGFIFKRASPSCGMERVKVYATDGRSIDKAAGAFAEEMMRGQPLLPTEEEGRLGDPGLRENFIMRVFVYHRWQRLSAEGITANRLIEFHADHKYLIMAHNQAAYQRMGRMLAEAGKADVERLAGEYVAELMGALARPVPRKQHVNVLQHLLGYLKQSLDAEDKAEMLEVIEQYRDGIVPLIVPITLLKHHFRRHPHEYIERQVYLTPHPHELMLRNLI
jgi:uncharacterized protein YbgA (DUF1722 family)/uncharacterized protein YbbK (DUF523 family)